MQGDNQQHDKERTTHYKKVRYFQTKALQDTKHEKTYLA